MPVRQEWRRVTPPDALNMSPSLLSRDSTKKGSAKALLHELCTRQRWKLPVYECYHDEGPPHKRWFAFKVTVEVEGAKATTTLESFGNPQTTKKAAADAAAAGALWCLRHMAIS